MINRTKLLIIPIFIFVLLLTACENFLKQSAISIDTNAYYSIYQKSPNAEWNILNKDNAGYGFKTITFTLDSDNSAFGVVFVCPSEREDLPHEIHTYYSTKSEMELLNFRCRKPLDEIIEKPLYGSIDGVKIADAENKDGEVVRLALSNDVTLNAWEAYAATVRTGIRDIVALKGSQSADNKISPKNFLIRRTVPLEISAVPFELNIDFSGEDRSYLVRSFDEAARSTVNVTGANSGESVHSSVGFLSRSKTVLQLNEENQSSFSFLPVPLDEFTEIVDEFFIPTEFNPGEGHELLVTARSADGLVTREVSKFFTVSNGLTHNVHLPQSIPDVPLVALRNIEDLQLLGVDLKWSAYQDANSGDARLYRWELEGLAADPIPEKKPDISVDKVKWYVTVTPGWISKALGSNLTLRVPLFFEAESVDSRIDSDDAWRREWSFRKGSSIDWQMSVITVDDNNKAEDVIDYLLNRNVDKDLLFSQVYVRSSTAPLL